MKQPPLPSLHARLALAMAAAMALVLVLMGWLVYKGIEADAIEDDHALLQGTAQWVRSFIPQVQTDAAAQQVLEQRLADLQRLRPDLRVSIRESVWPAEQDSTAPRLLRQAPAASPVRTTDEAGTPIDAIHLRIERSAPLPPLHVQLALPVGQREQRLRDQQRVLLVVGLGGILLTTALSVLIARWGLRRIGRMAREARATRSGSRLSLAHVDAELLGLVTAFNRALEHLETAYQQMEGFSADVAHELRSPLAVLISGTQTTLVEERSVDELREALASNLEDLERLKALVNDMLFLARADQGERAQSLERVDLGQLADTTLEYCSALFDEAGVSVGREGEASAVCNPALVRRAMVNLLSNAARHADGERRVVLRLDALPGKVSIAVFNTGEPLSDAVLGRMFDRFFRARHAADQHHEGHGLGLTIVQAVARMHGGRVFAQAQPDGNLIGLLLPGALATGQRRLREHENGWSLSDL